MTVRPEVLAKAEAAVAEGGASSVSAWVDQAMAEKASRGDLRTLLDEMEAESPSTQEDRLWAQNVLGL